MGIKVGDKEYSEEEAAKLIESHEQLSQQMEKLKPVLEVTEEYGVTPEQFINESKGAFGAILRLQEVGILDKDGQIVEKPATPPPPADPPHTPESPAGTPSPQGEPGLSADAIAKKALEKVKPVIDDLRKENELLKSSVNRIYREKITETARQKNLDVSDEDISIAFAEVSKSGQDFWDVLGKRSERNQSVKSKAIEEFAKKHNLDIGELNKLNEISSTDGKVASAIVEGKKLVRKPAKGGVTPLDATRQLFKMKGQM